MTFKTASVCSMLVAVGCLTCTCEAATGLRGAQISGLELGSLLAQVEGYLGRGGTNASIARLESVLAPMYAALPKNERGRLAQPVVRYALHRLFARQGMLVTGLDTQGSSWNESSTPTAVLSERVPSFVESMLEERLADHGFGLNDLATLAVALKHLFNTEATSRLEVAYQLKYVPVGDTLDDAEVAKVLDMYMLIYIMESNLTNASWVRRAQYHAERFYPGWPDARMWVHDTRQNLAFAERDRTNPFVIHDSDFSGVLHIVEELHEQYGLSQNAECQELKDSLLENEFGNSGRVRLADFHGSALKGKWQFTEGKNYLRQLGALDESNPEDPRVVVPNYLYSRTNCVAKSGFYQVCCINECESILEHLESSIAKPEASPQEVAALVAHLPSSTVPAPRNLSQVLLERLDAVAAAHGGFVPLHSRLFSLVLHHAYPRECPYPHLSGTTRPMTARQWIRETGEKHTASKEEMQQHAQRASWGAEGAEFAAAALGEEAERLLPWSSEEELLYSQSHPEQQRGGLSWTRVLLWLTGILASGCSLAKTAWSARSSMDPPALKYYV